MNTQDKLLTADKLWAVWNVKQDNPEFCLPAKNHDVLF